MGISRESLPTRGEAGRDGRIWESAESIPTREEVGRDGRRWESAERAYQHEERQVEMGGDGNKQREHTNTRRGRQRWEMGITRESIPT